MFTVRRHIQWSGAPVKSYFLRLQLLIGIPLGEGHWLPPRPLKTRVCLFLGVEPADRWIRHHR